MLLACFLLIIACGRSADTTDADRIDDPGAVQSADEDSDGDAAAIEPQKFTVDQRFWHSGFHVELSDGSYYSEEDDLTGEVRYFVSIAASFENLGDDQTFFDSQSALNWEGNSTVALLSSDFPLVPSGLSTDGSLIFRVDAGFDPASAYMLVGSADENQARVPLGPDGGDPNTLEPIEPQVTGSISMELIDLTFNSAELRADRPVSYSEVEQGKLALTLYFDATSRRGGNWSLNAQDFALISTDGDAAAADGAELGSLPGSDSGLVTSDLYVRFLVDDPPGGEYTLRFAPGEWFVGSDGVTEGSFVFTLE